MGRAVKVTGVIWFILSVVGAARADELPRVASLDYCADQYVLAVADPAQVLALSLEAADVHSFYRDRAKGLPVVRADAESVLAMEPDLVIRNWGGDLRMLALLDRAGIKVMTATYGGGPDVMLSNLRRFADAMGRAEEAEALIARTRKNLETAIGAPRLGLTAAYVAPGGITAGVGTFVDEIINAAGFETSASKLGFKGWRPLPLEAFVSDPPDVIIASFYDLKQAKASNWSVARHARVREMLETTPTIYVPGRYFSCNGLFFADTVAFIRKEAERTGLAAAPARDALHEARP